jgi:3-dehydroquinate dehydratase-2
MKKILIIHGANLNMFGKRDPAQYGTITLDEINEKLRDLAKGLGVSIETYQTNHEGAIVEKIHQAHLD